MPVLEIEKRAASEEMAAHWDRLADTVLAKKALDSAHGSVAAHDAKIRTYRRTAESIRLEIATGRAHCVCCLSPETTHRPPA